MGRLAAVFFAAAGLLLVATLPLTPDDSHRAGTAGVGVAAAVIGGVAWLVPWERLPDRATLVLVPPAFALIALGNLLGGSDYHAYGIFFVVAFVWLGLAHRPWTSVAVSPLAAVAYLVPIFLLPGDKAVGVGSAFVTIPICVIVGEALARGLDRLSQTQAALRQERQLAQSLLALDTMKTTFMRSASHELRTPITICRGHLEVLPAAPATEELASTVRVVVDELDRMSRLVDDITTLTRVEDPAGLRIDDVPVDRLLSDIASKATSLLNGRLHVTDADAGEVIRADRGRLEQAVLNLLQNAAVHAGDGPVELRLEGSGGRWRLEVADRGPGIGELDPREIFEPFHARPRSPGSGLGLAIVDRIARAHGGTAGVESSDAGSTFWIRVPR